MSNFSKVMFVVVALATLFASVSPTFAAGSEPSPVPANSPDCRYVWIKNSVTLEVTVRKASKLEEAVCKVTGKMKTVTVDPITWQKIKDALRKAVDDYNNVPDDKNPFRFVPRGQ